MDRDVSKINSSAFIQLPYAPTLPIARLARLFASTSASYKFFWFKALFERAAAGERVMTYRDLAGDMITEAWYMVTEYHLSLGATDQLQHLVLSLQARFGLKSSERAQVILEHLRRCDDPDILRQEEGLLNMVPYRLQSAFLPEVGRAGVYAGTPRAQILRLNAYRDLMYYYSEYRRLDTTITMDPAWMDYLTQNQEIIRGWLSYSLIRYLQARNPSVPGIADKLTPPAARDLTSVKRYWKILLAVHPVPDIYTGQLMDGHDFSVDHFVPWSYVAHDELWNLSPTTRSVNSSKNSDLPAWERYFPRLQRQEYALYTEIWKRDTVRAAFRKCADHNLNDERVRATLYREGQTEQQFSAQLEEILSPVYRSARNCGFREWHAAE